MPLIVEETEPERLKKTMPIWELLSEWCVWAEKKVACMKLNWAKGKLAAPMLNRMTV
jgi:hypothetical protein